MRKVISMAITFFFVIALTTIMSSASAHNDRYGYWGCTQRAKTAHSPHNIGFLPSDLPADGTCDGVSNSFRNRLSDATAVINAAATGPDAQPYGASYMGHVFSDSMLNVRVLTSTLGAAILGIADMVPTSCTVVRGSKTNISSFITVRIAVRSDWFSQNNSRRALRENCPNTGYSPTYTYSKKFDLGSTMTRELGHSIGLVHPSQTQAHTATNVMGLAKCTVANDQATMCPNQDAYDSGVHRAYKRTFDSWDHTSASRAF